MFRQPILNYLNDVKTIMKRTANILYQIELYFSQQEPKIRQENYPKINRSLLVSIKNPIL